jgi:two-component system nitrogen regulation response regulator GlnG/two-component system response regulator HydG
MIVLHAPDDTEHIGAWISAAATRAGQPGVLGRGLPQADDERIRLQAVRQRPGTNTPLPPFASPSLSREQLLVHTVGSDSLELKKIGRRPLAVNGNETNVARVHAGDVVEIGSQLVLLVASRPATLPTQRHFDAHPFGEADVHGFVGEAPIAWVLRAEIAFMGPLPGHVLITGATGTGKEIVAAAFHQLSGRGGHLVARNAATFPESLVDAELFGNLKGYPNPGMSERKGLVGTADRGSLFLDEFGELAAEAQAKLLRVLDSGEYQTLGESRARHSDFRFIAATNKPEEAIRPDLLARFDMRIRTPSLVERREDVPFLVRHLLVSMTAPHPELRERVFGDRTWPVLSTSLVSRLARAPFPANVRELRSLLWQSVSKSTGDALEWPENASAPAEPAADNKEARELERVLSENGGSIERSWRALGLSSRFALMRLLRKHGITEIRRSARE